MGGVAPGSPVSAANSNQAWIDANGDDATIGRLGLQNTLAESGAFIDNDQRQHNATSSYTGVPINAAKDVLPAWVNNDVGLNTNNTFQRADALTQKFNDTAGHKHTGAPGDAPPIASTSVTNVPLRGYAIGGTNITGATGLSTDVSGLMVSFSPSSGSTVEGVVVTPGLNKTFIFDSNGDKIEDGSGNEVYGRLTYLTGVWTLSYYSLVVGVETPYSFASPTDLQWFFQQLFNPIVDAPVYSDLFVVESSNTTADVLDATETVAGKAAFYNVDSTPVSTTNDRGTSNRFAHGDHTHEGVHSIAEFTEGIQTFGDILLQGMSGVTITRTGNTYTFAGSGGVAFQEVPGGPVNGVNDTFGPLSNTPSSSESILVFVDGAPVDKAGWSQVGLSIVFGVGYIPVSGQDVYVYYLSSGTPVVPPITSGTLKTEFRTLTSGESTAKKIILAFTPADPGGVLVDIIGGTSQEFNVDYTVVANEVRWNGYALDGLLTTGDKLRVHYIT